MSYFNIFKEHFYYIVNNINIDEEKMKKIKPVLNYIKNIIPLETNLNFDLINRANEVKKILIERDDYLEINKTIFDELKKYKLMKDMYKITNYIIYLKTNKIVNWQ